MLKDMTLLAIGTDWLPCIDVCEHHVVDFETVADRGGDGGVIVRAGRGTRQDTHRKVRTSTPARPVTL